jgi:3-phosphoshikimate 1-carboxyvinyltransferase
MGAAAITHTRLDIVNLDPCSQQADKKIVEILSNMGVEIITNTNGYTINNSHSELRSVSVDMADCPDIIPTVAVIAAFASGSSIIHGVETLKYKECDRLTATVKELNKIGIKAFTDGSFLEVHGGETSAGTIDTYNDHRIAMSFALAALVNNNIDISDKNVVNKSFPRFFECFDDVFGNTN